MPAVRPMWNNAFAIDTDSDIDPYTTYETETIDTFAGLPLSAVAAVRLYGQ